MRSAMPLGRSFRSDPEEIDCAHLAGGSSRLSDGMSGSYDGAVSDSDGRGGGDRYADTARRDRGRRTLRALASTRDRHPR